MADEVPALNPNAPDSQESFVKNSFLRFLETCAAAAPPPPRTHTHARAHRCPHRHRPGAHRWLCARCSYERPSEDGQPPVAEYKERCAPAGARPPASRVGPLR